MKFTKHLIKTILLPEILFQPLSTKTKTTKTLTQKLLSHLGHFWNDLLDDIKLPKK